MSDKEAMLKLLDKEYQNLLQAIDGLDADQLTRVWFGTWSVRDMIAHILGWQRETTRVLQRLVRGEPREEEAADYSNGDEWNARFVREMASISPGAVLATWRRVHMDYVRAANDLPEELFGEGKTAGALLHRTAVDDFRQHAADILGWRQRESI
jgi:hypothetical protein